MNQAFTKNEVIERLQALADGDTESAHIEADSLLLDALLIAGMGDVVSAYQTARDGIGFWYA
jgi:hypothetical protein